MLYRYSNILKFCKRLIIHRSLFFFVALPVMRLGTLITLLGGEDIERLSPPHSMQRNLVPDGDADGQGRMAAEACSSDAGCEDEVALPGRALRDGLSFCK